MEPLTEEEVLQVIEAWFATKHSTLWGPTSTNIFEADSKRRAAQWFLHELRDFNAYIGVQEGG